MEACKADSLASATSPSYNFPNKSYHTFIWTCGLGWLVRSHLNDMRSQYRDANRHINTRSQAAFPQLIEIFIKMTITLGEEVCTNRIYYTVFSCK